MIYSFGYRIILTNNDDKMKMSYWIGFIITLYCVCSTERQRERKLIRIFRMYNMKSCSVFIHIYLQKTSKRKKTLRYACFKCVTVFQSCTNKIEKKHAFTSVSI